MTYLDLAKKIWEGNWKIMASWSPETATIWAKAKNRCVYCDFDFTQSRGLAYYFSSIDHLIPKSKHPELENVLWNKVLSCRSCNALKRDFDPLDAHEVAPSPLEEPSPSTIDRWRDSAKKQIQEVQLPKDSNFSLELEQIALLMSEYAEFEINANTSGDSLGMQAAIAIDHQLRYAAGFASDTRDEESMKRELDIAAQATRRIQQS